MGSILARGLVAAGWSPAEIALCVRRPEHASELGGEGFRATVDPTEAVDGADLVVLATKPKDISAMIESVRDAISANQTVLSVAAGVQISTIEDALPGISVIRAMPNTPASLRKAATGYALGSLAGHQHEQLVKHALSSVGLAIRVEESMLNAVTAVSGSGPAYVFYLAEAMAAAGVELGLEPGIATQLANQTVLGAGAMLTGEGLAGEGVDPATLREHVTSPGGTTAAAIEVLENNDFKQLVADALRAARDRARRIGLANWADEFGWRIGLSTARRPGGQGLAPLNSDARKSPSFEPGGGSSRFASRKSVDRKRRLMRLPHPLTAAPNAATMPPPTRRPIPRTIRVCHQKNPPRIPKNAASQKPSAASTPTPIPARPTLCGINSSTLSETM